MVNVIEDSPVESAVMGDESKNVPEAVGVGRWSMLKVTVGPMAAVSNLESIIVPGKCGPGILPAAGLPITHV